MKGGHYDLSNWATLVQTVSMLDGKPSETIDPVNEFVDQMLIDAIRSGASHIYFEPYEFNYRVRYLTDGEIHTVATPTAEPGPKIAAKMKSDADNNSTSAAGRFPIRLSKTKSIHVRVDVLTTTFGEKIAARILDPAVATVGFEQLGIEPSPLKSLRAALTARRGLIVF
jgi:type IV pilus assembly protein PilB